MPYAYGTSPVHGYPTPLDGTPLDAVSWAHLVDALGVGDPRVCASKAEQDAYVAAVQAAGLGPSSRQIIRVCRTDLNGLIMRNDGTGWVRETGGVLQAWGHVEASTTESAGTTSARGGVAVDLPASALVRVHADVLALPPAEPDSWAFRLWLQDQTGRRLCPDRQYSNTGRDQVNATLDVTVQMPAGAGRIDLMTWVADSSGPIGWRNILITASY